MNIFRIKYFILILNVNLHIKKKTYLKKKFNDAVEYIVMSFLLHTQLVSSQTTPLETAC